MALESLEADMLTTLPGRFPWHAAVLGETGLRRVLRFGVQRAGMHGIFNAGLLRTYVELTFALGGLFDGDPLLPWAARALGEPSDGEAARMDRLYAAAVDYFRAVGAEEDSPHPVARAHRLMGEDRDAELLVREDTAIPAMWRARPAFSAHVGEPLLGALVRRAPAESARLGMGGAPGAALFIALSFALGHGFADDPLYPWIRSAIAAGATSAERVALLRGEVARWASTSR